jgi:hypothetical protein
MNRLHENDIKFGQPLVKAPLTDKHKLNRVKWANKYINMDWKTVIFTDEAQIIKGPHGKYRWVDTKGDEYDCNIKHPVKINIWAEIKHKGPNRIHIIVGNLNGEQYIDILNSNILDLIYNDENLIYQDDNDPKHRCKLVCEWKKENLIKSIDWPSNSPDLNPMENGWNLLKHKLIGKEYDTKEEFTKDIIDKWEEIDLSIVNKLIDSMPKRLQLIIDKNGDRIDY